jgi:hypothetical protein
MKKVIYKYELIIKYSQIIDLPIGAKIISCQMQGEKLMLWAEVNPLAKTEKRMFNIYATGEGFIESHKYTMQHIASIQLEGGKLLAHVYEVAP